MKQYIPQDWKIHVHCFTDSLQFAKTLITEWPNLWLGYSGVITFKKNNQPLQTVVKEIPLDKVLLETDAPFMTPEPYRGKICHPGFIPVIATKVSQLKGVNIDEVYTACRRNTNVMYGI
eukprot:TRINITY_DN4149_c0_g1_i10.p2 TRINITY_DN4149_c0_g1~~TRINITY_DN4149_c0_g1_i10.p2  ORF type:complete len:119 (-),score=17.74 TRINITY_DN4149_c0_g1_i10:109-465(-)